MSAAGIYAREFDSLDCFVQLGVAGDRVISVSFPRERPMDAGTDHELLDRVGDYLAGAEDDFADVPVGLTLPTDQRRVLEAIRNVPYGEHVDVELAARMTPDLDHDSEDGRRTVQDALTANPVPPFVPDHRVDGAPSGAPDRVARAFRELEA
jgi:methylated-DNA-[protein]-cysteine S-methyltransferase